MNQTISRFRFLYEIDQPIQSSGYDRDPRIEEIRKKRNPKEDAPIVLDCKPEEIAWSSEDINRKTKAYIGKLDEKTFNLIQERGIEQVYTSFSGGKIDIEKDFEAEGITLAEFEQKAQGRNQNIKDESLKIKIYDYAKDMAQKIGTPEHPALKGREIFTLVRLKVRDLFQDEQVHTINEIFAKARELGLELCPPEVGLIKRLKDTNQPMSNWYYIAMEPITDRSRDPYVFTLERRGGGLWLGRGIADPGRGWPPGGGFVFRLRKQNLKT